MGDRAEDATKETTRSPKSTQALHAEGPEAHAQAYKLANPMGASLSPPHSTDADTAVILNFKTFTGCNRYLQSKTKTNPPMSTLTNLPGSPHAQRPASFPQAVCITSTAYAVEHFRFRLRVTSQKRCKKNYIQSLRFAIIHERVHLLFCKRGGSKFPKPRAHSRCFSTNRHIFPRDP